MDARKTIAVVTMDADIVKFYASELDYLFHDYADILTYNTQDGSANVIRPADVYAVSTCVFDTNKELGKKLASDENFVLLKMTITRKSLNQLMALPYGTQAMMVNLSRPMALETIVLLNQLGIKNISFEPVYPGMEIVPDIDLAVTPGEMRYVPARARTVIDIGNRLIDVNTMIKIAAKLRCDEVLTDQNFMNYIGELVRDDYSFNHIFDKSLYLDGQFCTLLSFLNIGLIGVNAQNTVITFSQKAEYVLDMKGADVLDRHAQDVLPFIPFQECSKEGAETRSLLIKARGSVVNTTLTPVVRGSRYLGAFAVVDRFEDQECKQSILRRQLMQKGYTTKYTFDDVKGRSPSILNAVRIAQKMAVTKSSILISGESGTGKELFAHAIHSTSPRKDNPFVAINCAAIPDALFESELFGYEEGAFTGARKGGKPGLFEVAHKGTLFLDEVEGLSPNLQVKLLRAIQEKEVMRVGGSRIINVDVRIIAATNEDLLGMVREGKFRRDLYYRLSTLPLTLPPLRKRQDDVLLLLDSFREQLGGDFTLASDAVDLLRNHRWDGNIRELRNCVEYLIYVGDSTIHAKDLPPYFTETLAASMEDFPIDVGDRREEYLFVLQQLEAAGISGRGAGRKSIAEEAEKRHLYLSEQQVRWILVDLERSGAVRSVKGRSGSCITDSGKRLLESLK
jgi:transcriptional regulator with PAS, ATPase and Fis domain